MRPRDRGRTTVAPIEPATVATVAQSEHDRGSATVSHGQPQSDFREELRRRQLDRTAEFERRRAEQARLRAAMAANRARGKQIHHDRRMKGRR